MTVDETLEKARNALDEGDEKQAARSLNHALILTGDERVVKQIHDLAVKGRDNSKLGSFRRAIRWNGVISTSERRLSAGAATG